MIVKGVLLAVCIAVTGSNRAEESIVLDDHDELPPIILVPGFTGCSIENKLTGKKGTPSCPTDTKDWEVLWLEASELSMNPVCFLENIVMNIKTSSDGEFESFANVEGETIRPRDFGGVDGMCYLDKNKTLSSFYLQVVQYFTKEGWVVGTNLFGAPYDWRMGGNRYDDYFNDLKELIENATETTGKRAVIFAHSMGPSVILEFLYSMTIAWKQENIAAFMAVAPVWSGNVLSVWNAASGLDCKSAFGAHCPGGEGALTKAFLREIGANIPASFWTFPMRGSDSDNYTWSDTEVIVSTPNKNYTAYDMPEMFRDLGLDTSAEMNEIIQNSSAKNRFLPPLVDTHVFYGYGVKTPARFIYNISFNKQPLPPQAIDIDYGPESDYGDGAAPLRSSLRSNSYEWRLVQDRHMKQLTHRGYKGMSHSNTIEPLPDIVAIIKKIREGDARNQSDYRNHTML
eukprot:m.210504 g.210504  ORF g.210504 m.210504 type:complete len:456 (+) comp19010_c0_seq2:225-1592(+)